MDELTLGGLVRLLKLRHAVAIGSLIVAMVTTSIVLGMRWEQRQTDIAEQHVRDLEAEARFLRAKVGFLDLVDTIQCHSILRTGDPTKLYWDRESYSYSDEAEHAKLMEIYSDALHKLVDPSDGGAPIARLNNSRGGPPCLFFPDDQTVMYLFCEWH